MYYWGPGGVRGRSCNRGLNTGLPTHVYIKGLHCEADVYKIPLAGVHELFRRNSSATIQPTWQYVLMRVIWTLTIVVEAKEVRIDCPQP